MKQVDISLISKYRVELMGIATIGILICHAVGNHVLFPRPLEIVLCFGQMGNSLFLFLSGFGLYYSLQKSQVTNSNLLDWYKRRITRILVPYTLWYIVHFVRAYYNPETNWLQFLYGFSLIKYWTHGGGAWFLSVLLPLYAVSPILKKIISLKGNTGYNVILITVILTIASFLHSDVFFFEQILKAMPHCVAFILGMVAGEYSQQKRSLNLLYFIGYGTLLLFSFVVINKDFGNLYLSACMFAIPVFIYLLEHIKHTWTMLRWFGRISLESYLTNGALPKFVALIPWAAFVPSLNYGNYVGYSIVIIGGLLWAWLLHIISRWILNRMKIQ